MIRRGLAAFATGFVVVGGIGWWGSPLATQAALLAGAGLALMFGFRRVSVGVLAVPPWTAVLGALAFAFGTTMVVAPRALYLPELDRRLMRISSFDDTRFFVDRGAPAWGFDAQMRTAFGNYVVATRDLIGDVRDCPLDIVFAADPSAGATPFGSYQRPLIGRPTVFVQRGAGWGSLTHHMMLGYASCALPRQPQWVVVGLAALVEKHTIVDGVFNLHWRSTWRELEQGAPAPAFDLHEVLEDSADQGLLRALFLHLESRGALTPFLKRLRAGESAEQALLAELGGDPTGAVAGFRHFLEQDLMKVPELETARPFEHAAPL
jgi:hypothetical protein